MAFLKNLNFDTLHRMPTIWELRNMLHFSFVQGAGPFNHNLHHISMSKWSDALQMGWKISVICHNESRHVAKLPRFSYIYFSGQKKSTNLVNVLVIFLKYKFMQRIYDLCLFLSNFAGMSIGFLPNHWKAVGFFIVAKIVQA